MRLYAQMLHKVNLGLKRSYTSREEHYEVIFFKFLEYIDHCLKRKYGSREPF